MKRGTLRIYLGAAPGVGTTFAMLDEGIRRRARGADVVVGSLARQGRAAITERLSQLTSSPAGVAAARPPLPNADSDWLVAIDVDALVARRPTIVLVDDAARPSAVAGGAPQWHALDQLLDAGIDVITTVRVDQLESLHDVVARITGRAPTDTIPDAVVRAADQLELVDMSPEALRRRLAHGNVHPPERVDAAMANQFRVGNLGALRELALLWLADVVQAQMQQHDADHAITTSWEVRERVVVALTGVDGTRLVRRAGRIAGRVRGELIGVHVVAGDIQPGPDLELQRQLVAALGGTYREVVAEDVVDGLLGFARVEAATQLVVGEREGRAGRPAGDRSVATRLIERLGDTDGPDTGRVDIHVVSTVAAATPAPRRRSWARHHAGARRRFGPQAWALCSIGLVALTAGFVLVRDHVSLGSVLLVDLVMVLAVAALGGMRPGVVAAFVAVGLTNWFLTPPLHTLAVNDPENIVALAVFVAVAVVVGALVDRAASRSREAGRARAEAGALARSAATLVGALDPLPDLVEQLRTTFGLAAVSVLERHDDGWWPTVTVGEPPLLDPTDGYAVPLGDGVAPGGGRAAGGQVQLVLSTGLLGPDQLEVLRAFADQLAVALEGRRLRAEAANAALLTEADALRAALLRSVSHDLRTPLATIKASASGLLQEGVVFSDADRFVLLSDIDRAADRLNDLVRNLLDMSRLQVGAIELATRFVALEEVVAAAVAATTTGKNDVPVRIAVSETLPLVHADAALLERALANLVSNARAWSPPGGEVRVEADQVGAFVDLRVVDRGPGIPLADRERMFLPFQRLGDRSNDAGVGLGLAIAKGFIDSMGASLEADDTPGGGLTMAIRLLAGPADPIVGVVDADDGGVDIDIDIDIDIDGDVDVAPAHVEGPS